MMTPDEKKPVADLLREELGSLLVIKQTDRLWHIPLLASLCSGVPLFTGYFIERFEYGILASLAGLVILYLPSTSLAHRMTILMACSFGMMMAFTLGSFFSFNPYVAVIALTLISFCVHWAIQYFEVKPPGNFFFIMIASIAICSPFEGEKIPERIGIIGIGTMLATTLALVYSILMIHRPVVKVEATADKKPRKYIYIESFISAFFIGGSLLVAHILAMKNPYWVPISCLAVMQGLNFRQVWQRSIHRIVGTFIGLGLTWIMLSLKVTPLSICISIMVLQFVVEMLIVRHYGLAVIFMTPLTVLLAEAAQAMTVAPEHLIIARGKDIILGSIIGAVGGWFLYHEKLRTHTEALIKKWDDES